MKRWIIFFCLLWIGITNVSADQFSDEPSRYVKTIRSDRYVGYIDKNTLQVLRYDPPYYIIEADIVYILYDRNQIMRTKERNFYDMKTGTMRTLPTYFTMYDMEGNKLRSFDSERTKPVTWKQGEHGWYITDHLFLIEYGKPFTAFYRERQGK